MTAMQPSRGPKGFASCKKRGRYLKLAILGVLHSFTCNISILFFGPGVIFATTLEQNRYFCCCDVPRAFQVPKKKFRQPASQATSQPTSQPGSQPASLTDPANQRASQPSQPASHPISPASSQASRPQNASKNSHAIMLYAAYMSDMFRSLLLAAATDL